MKVLIVHPCKGFYGGAEEVVVQLTNYLRDNGHHVQIVTKDVPKELLEGITDKKGQPAVYDWNSWKMMRWWTQKLMDWADVINVHNFPATLASFPTKKPIVWMCNEPAELFTNWWRKPIEAFNRWWVKKSGMKVVVADQVNAYRFFNIYGVVPKAIIPYGVDYKFWSSGFPEEPKDERDNFVRLLQVGTITPYKNQLESLRVLSVLQDMGIPSQLAFVGSGDKSYIEELEHYIRAARLKNVHFLGQKSQAEVLELYQYFDILLHPVKGQGGWLVPFEAICAGLPVIVSKEFTGADIIKENNLGMVTNDYARGIIEVQSYLEAIKGDTLDHTREWVKENLTWEKFGEGMVKVFEEAMNNSGG